MHLLSRYEYDFSNKCIHTGSPVNPVIAKCADDRRTDAMLTNGTIPGAHIA